MSNQVEKEHLRQRILSIDILRGFVMVLMALDHVRDYFHIEAMTGDPLDYETSTLPLYFTRWITHYCAPVFVFLSGISAYLSSKNKTKNEASVFLLKRGLFLVLMEVTVICFGWTFNPFFNMLVMQVIWAIGISMMALALLSRLPKGSVLFISILILAGHNLLDGFDIKEKNLSGMVWDMLHDGGFSYYALLKNHGVLVVYPVLPWIGIMALGYCFGTFYGKEYPAEKRKQQLLRISLGLLILFFVLRGIDLYGDKKHWEIQASFAMTLMDFLDVSKYPPSLIFTCMTIGPACFVLALTENSSDRFSKWMMVYGRVPFFYYILHIYFIHLLCVATFYASGYRNSDIISEHSFFNFRPAEMGFELPIVWLIWLAVVWALYYPSRWYHSYRSTRKHWIYKYI